MTRPPFFSDTALASVAPPSPAGGGDLPELDTAAAAEAAQPAGLPKIRRKKEDADGGSTRADEALRFWTITAAALADSVNPCAFATIIILVAMMSSAKRTKGEIIAVCLSFTASVFITYFAIGWFLHRIISTLQEQGGWFLFIADIVYYLAFALCVVCAFFSLRDAYMLHRGRSAEEMVLQLPKAFKKRINVAMAKGIRSSWLVAGVFMTGITVSFLEAACTGQVYLPTIFMIGKAGFWQMMGILAWYNLLFISPLLLIFGLVLWGITSNQLADFFKTHVKWTKLALGVVFIAMGYFMLQEMHWPPGHRGFNAEASETRDGG